MKKLVVKIGTKSLLTAAGGLDSQLLASLAGQVKELQKKGWGVVIITSGAVASGKFLLSNKDCSHKLFASVGQVELMKAYQEALKKHQLTVGQLMVSHNDLVDRETFASLSKVLLEMLQVGVIPILNENDPLTRDTKVQFGDNDSLAAKVALIVQADSLLLLSHIDGLYDFSGDSGRLIRRIDDPNTPLLKYSQRRKSEEGRGGMFSKLRAIRLLTAFGIEAVIAAAKVKNVLIQAVSSDQPGTVFRPRKGRRLKNRDRWLLSAKVSAGSVLIDHGAYRAIGSRRSLLAVGVQQVLGTFEVGDVIEVLNTDHEVVAVGITKISGQDLQTMIRGNARHGQEVIHVDSLIPV